MSYYEFKENFIFDEDRNFVRTDYSLQKVSILPVVPSISYIIDLSSGKE